jgi:hypothetical protein
MGKLLGELLTNDQCWDEWDKDRAYDISYDMFEQGLPDNAIDSIESIDLAFEAMEATQLLKPIDQASEDLYFEFHAETKTVIPYWEHCLNRINKALS